MSDKGIYQKYRTQRTDGQDKTGCKHEHCSTFTIDLSCDPHAEAAIEAYADSCAKDKPELAADLRKWLKSRDIFPSSSDSRRPFV